MQNAQCRAHPWLIGKSSKAFCKAIRFAPSESYAKTAALPIITSVGEESGDAGWLESPSRGKNKIAPAMAVL